MYDVSNQHIRMIQNKHIQYTTIYYRYISFQNLPATEITTSGEDDHSCIMFRVTRFVLIS